MGVLNAVAMMCSCVVWCVLLTGRAWLGAALHFAGLGMGSGSRGGPSRSCPLAVRCLSSVRLGLLFWRQEGLPACAGRAWLCAGGAAGRSGDWEGLAQSCKGLAGPGCVLGCCTAAPPAHNGPRWREGGFSALIS